MVLNHKLGISFINDFELADYEVQVGENEFLERNFAFVTSIDGRGRGGFNILSRRSKALCVLNPFEPSLQMIRFSAIL